MSSSSLSAGQGFLTYVFQDIDFDGDSDLPITLSVAGSSTTGDVTIGSIPSGDYYLAGNPYPQTIDWDLITQKQIFHLQLLYGTMQPVLGKLGTDLLAI